MKNEKEGKTKLIDEIVNLIPNYLKKEIESSISCDDENDESIYNVVVVLFEDGWYSGYSVDIHRYGDDYREYEDLFLRLHLDRSTEEFDVDQILFQKLEEYPVDDLKEVFEGMKKFVSSSLIF